MQTGFYEIGNQDVKWDGGGADTPETLDERQEKEDSVCVKETNKQNKDSFVYAGPVEDLCLYRLIIRPFQFSEKLHKVLPPPH